MPTNKPTDHIGPVRTDYLAVGNGVRVRLLLEWDEDGAPYVRLDVDGGDLEGAEPGMYYVVPRD